jgi:tRNA threonylcarbamoyladenosine modification (KEOPS) complex Cgi121 subunit
MLHYFEEFSKYVEITGYNNVSFLKAEAFLKANRKKTRQVDIQFFDADLIATQEHLYFAVLNALQAFRSKTNISKSTAMETMLYASAKRQIQKAIDQIGIKFQTKDVAVVIFGDDPKGIEALLGALSISLGCVPDDTVLQLTKEKRAKIREAFEISPKELETETDGGGEKALVDLVVEHVALLATEL